MTAMDEAPGPDLYVPYTQSPYPSMSTMQFAVRTTASVPSMAAAIQKAIRQEDSELPIASVHPMQELIDDTTASVRFAITLLSIFAAIAWLLAVVGVYAIVSYLVSERMHEMGVRVALGARPVNLLSLVFSAGMRFIVIGVATGLILLLALSRLLQHFIYEVRVVDPVTYLVVALLMLIAAGLAMLVPAHKAMRADPMTVLRTD